LKKGINYCYEICELLEIGGIFRTPRPPLATGLSSSDDCQKTRWRRFRGDVAR